MSLSQPKPSHACGGRVTRNDAIDAFACAVSIACVTARAWKSAPQRAAIHVAQLDGVGPAPTPS